MENLNINTVQNVEISNKIAGVGDRILAYIFDVLVFMGYFMFLGLISYFIETNFDTVMLIILIVIPYGFYDLIAETFFNGQSFGKKIMKIRVVRIDGTQASFYNYFIRWIFRLIDISISSGVIGMVTMIINGKGQRLGDLAAGTTVVRLKRRNNVENTIYQEIPEDYKPVFVNVQNLSEKDIKIINKVYQHLKIAEQNNENINLAYKTKKKIENTIKQKSELNPMHFFETVLKDYNYYNKT